MTILRSGEVVEKDLCTPYPVVDEKEKEETYREEELLGEERKGKTI